MSEPVKSGRITVAAIAEAAGVSRAAVYAVLNRRTPKTIGVSDATRSKIEATISDLGYIPNHAARSLVSGRSDTVGLLLSDPVAVFDRRQIDVFERVFAAQGYKIVPDFHRGDWQVERQLLMHFYSQNFDAVIVSLSDGSRNYDLLERFVKSGIPVIVLADEADHPDFHFVAFDEDRMMALLTGCLALAGIRRFAFVMPHRQPWSGASRLRRVRNALKQYPGLRLVAADSVGDYREAGELMTGYRNMAGAPEALFCYNDRLAVPLLHCLAAMRIPVPEVFSVIGIDGDEDPFSPQPLTSVRLPMEEMAEACWECFSVSGRDRPPLHIVIPELELIEGSTIRTLSCAVKP